MPRQHLRERATTWKRHPRQVHVAQRRILICHADRQGNLGLQVEVVHVITADHDCNIGVQGCNRGTQAQHSFEHAFSLFPGIPGRKQNMRRCESTHDACHYFASSKRLK